MNKQKVNGQYMSPKPIAQMILDRVGYTIDNPDIIQKTIMEPSFGDGVFLLEIVDRLLNVCELSDMSKEETIGLLNTKVYGIEKDEFLYNKAILTLNDFLNFRGYPSIQWVNLYCGDALIKYKDFSQKMDYVVGNPPYVRIHNIDNKYRYIAKNFIFSNGMIDLYILFYEIGIKMLSNDGQLGYISPNSFLKNTSQQGFRNYLLDNKYLSGVIDFKTSKIFSEADTYTCICFLNKQYNKENFFYNEYSMYEKVGENIYKYSDFIKNYYNKIWILNSQCNEEFIEQNKNKPQHLKDLCIVQNGIATNKDGLFIIKCYIDEKCTIPYIEEKDVSYVYFIDREKKTRKIETNILKRCVKESKYDGVKNNVYVIFPYQKIYANDIYDDNGSLIIIGYKVILEDILQNDYPYAYNYLQKYKEILLKRDISDSVKWYEFGRTQGIQNSIFKKIVFKHIISKQCTQVVPYILDGDTIVYSSMYTTIDINECIDIKDGKKVFNELRYNNILQQVYDIYSSSEFAKYCTTVGKDMSGGYVTLSTKMIKDFGY